jgi:hypothetical protein
LLVAGCQGIAVPLQGEEKKQYQREYMRRVRAGQALATKLRSSRLIACSFCGEVASPERPLVASDHARICAGCAAAAAEMIAKG